MITKCVYLLLLWLTYFDIALCAPVATTDSVKYQVIEGNEWASVPSKLDVYGKSDESTIPQVLHAIELKKKVQDKRQVTTGKSLEAKVFIKKRFGVRRTPLEKGLWGKRYVMQRDFPPSLMNKVQVPYYYIRSPSQQRNDVTNVKKSHNVISDGKALSDSRQRGIWDIRDVFVYPSALKQWRKTVKNAQRNDNHAATRGITDVQQKYSGPIEKGLWGKREDIDKDLNTVLYLRDTNEVNKLKDVRDTRKSREVYDEKGKRYIVLKTSGNNLFEEEKNIEERRTNPVEKGLWGKRYAQKVRENNAVLNSKSVRSIDNDGTVVKDRENSNAKRSVNGGGERRILVLS